MKHFVLNRSCKHPMCLLLTLLMCMSGFTSRAQIAINETNFPDENFRNYLLAQSYGADGVLTGNEINNIIDIDVSEKSIRSLKGIEYFTSLWFLDCRNNQLTDLDVSKNTSLWNLDCGNNQLTDLDVSKNTSLMTFSCGYNQLTALDVSKNTALEILYCSNNQLTALDVSKNTALYILNCSSNQLTSLDVTNCNALEKLDCYENQIKGGAMDALISSLPTITGEKAPFHVIYNTSWSTEGNECTKEQVAAALAKGWQPMENRNWNWVPYEGSIEPVAINEANFPDENFRNYLLEQSYGEDGVLTENEISQITSISVYYKEISSLTGIEYFTALEFLYCSSNKLAALDVSKNTALEYLSCYSNQLTALNLSGNTALKELECGNNQLTALDLSKNTALEELKCGNNQLAALDLLGNTALTTIRCYRNQLTALNVSGNTALTELDCSSNQLTALDLSGNAALTELDCSNNQLTALDLSKNTALKELDCYSNQIKGAAMDALISSLPTITGEKAPFHVVYYSSWETEGNDCTKEQVAAALAKGWQPMEYKNYEWVPYEGSIVHIAINETNFPDENFRNYLLQSYGTDVLTDSQIKVVTLINVSKKEISSLKGIEHFTALETLWCDNNQLTALDVSTNTALRSLDCDNNQLTALDVSKNTALYSLSCNDNQLTALDVSTNTELETLFCCNNQLTALDVSKNTVMENLNCENNQLTALDVSGVTALWALYCENNQLTALDVSTNTALYYLRCNDNQLTALDVSKNTALKELDCYNNQLTALDVSKNTALRYLYCYSNQIKGADMDALISSLPDKTGEYTYFRVIYNDEETIEGNACTKEQVAAAIAKGWEPMEYKDEEWVPYEGSDVTVQINTATISRGSQPVYTLSGQRLAAPKKGINIVGGKKVVVK